MCRFTVNHLMPISHDEVPVTIDLWSDHLGLQTGGGGGGVMRDTNLMVTQRQ